MCTTSSSQRTFDSSVILVDQQSAADSARPRTAFGGLNSWFRPVKIRKKCLSHTSVTTLFSPTFVMQGPAMGKSMANEGNDWDQRGTLSNNALQVRYRRRLSNRLHQGPSLSSVSLCRKKVQQMGHGTSHLVRRCRSRLSSM